MITGINHITLATKNLDKSFLFYKETLGFSPLCRWDKGAYFLAGDFWFCLNYDAAISNKVCSTHDAFTVSKDEFRAFSARILDAGIEVYKENTSYGESLYFLDPDGHRLEIHASDWESRLSEKKCDSGAWQNVEWFI